MNTELTNDTQTLNEHIKFHSLKEYCLKSACLLLNKPIPDNAEEALTNAYLLEDDIRDLFINYYLYMRCYTTKHMYSGSTVSIKAHIWDYINLYTSEVLPSMEDYDIFQIDEVITNHEKICRMYNPIAKRFLGIWELNFVRK